MRGRVKCPVCKGLGTITEDSGEYMFETRDPQTNRCLICNGTGYVGANKRLPDGAVASEAVKDRMGTQVRGIASESCAVKEGGGTHESLQLGVESFQPRNLEIGLELGKAETTPPQTAMTPAQMGVTVIVIGAVNESHKSIIESIIKAIKENNDGKTN